MSVSQTHFFRSIFTTLSPSSCTLVWRNKIIYRYTERIHYYIINTFDRYNNVVTEMLRFVRPPQLCNNNVNNALLFYNEMQIFTYYHVQHQRKIIYYLISFLFAIFLGPKYSKYLIIRLLRKAEVTNSFYGFIARPARKINPL